MQPFIIGQQTTTNHRVVLPFYLYAALGFLVGTVLLLFSTDVVGGHYFQPKLLAVTHTMALAWGTMMIFGASHQLLPVLVEGRLESLLLAYLTLILNAVGVPLLIYGFYFFDVGWPLQWGAALINLGVICYLINVTGSALKSNRKNVHAWFVITAAAWLLVTTFFGLLLVLNFRHFILPANSVEYLSLHAHLGIVGWFLLLVMGVGSRLIPMFLISKYTNPVLLWWIFGLLNTALICFSIFHLTGLTDSLYSFPVLAILMAIILLGKYCYRAYQVRIRKKIDAQLKSSLFSVAQMLLPLMVLILLLFLLPQGKYPQLAIVYGFCIFFGWLTAIILGMTFKTMPFIVWNKVYHNRTHQGSTPAPKDLFNEGLYKIMWYSYLTGFTLFISGIVLLHTLLLKIGAIALVLAAVQYVLNVVITLTHQSKSS